MSRPQELELGDAGIFIWLSSSGRGGNKHLTSVELRLRATPNPCGVMPAWLRLMTFPSTPGLLATAAVGSDGVRTGYQDHGGMAVIKSSNGIRRKLHMLRDRADSDMCEQGLFS